jgi:hypothetical protein
MNDDNTTQKVELDSAVVAVIQAEVSVAVQPFMARMEEIAQDVKSALSDHEKRLEDTPTKTGVQDLVRETIAKQMRPFFENINTKIDALTTTLTTKFEGIEKMAEHNRTDIVALERQDDTLLEKVAIAHAEGTAALQFSKQLRVDIMGTNDPNAPTSVVDRITDAISTMQLDIKTTLDRIAGNQIRHHERLEILESDHRQRQRRKQFWASLVETGKKYDGLSAKAKLIGIGLSGIAGAFIQFLIEHL